MKLGPKFKICRRVGDRVFGKCEGPKFTVSGTERIRRGGKHPKGAPSEYALQLTEKQKARFTYGLSERQFSNYVKQAKKKGGRPTTELYQKLESRVDNVIYRLGLTSSRQAARQMVSHGHIAVNGQKIKVPSYAVKVGDRVSVRSTSKNKGPFANLSEKLADKNTPEWLAFDPTKIEAEIKGRPIESSDGSINFVSVLEFYSR
ncbi:MAG: 30S ribosomal protein S4 [Candidatus Vogelbacteria bacterium CG10_big_fil_rev_8_21_14_0_10_49_38]|uniref:Small ribosomal subunit protein uS4 n=1 Tax=Candidatus Vogelbacteria bacterium CG10_big_fil_rev_8_21_14_0_10_49_38 TaxID=1975043 RepID=A0A2H0RHG3_9BACT|nr:MAG: 30S ribosomal protein S4 [bacterium CG10_49_38]PIR45866.1 MAG: 30S ribosomal protein S4 [Candidatus Vogelbacteria bacterium CG10_big_fil_rev_8_21_14_0_10_49_38]